jgi:hypothetical protein
MIHTYGSVMVEAIQIWSSENVVGISNTVLCLVVFKVSRLGRSYWGDEGTQCSAHNIR